MPKLNVEIVTTERIVYSGEVDAVIAPGSEGQLGILPHHAPLMTSLSAGELVLRNGKEEEILAISGGFIEVRPERVIILADQAERAEDIDISRAEAARRKAEERLKQGPSGTEEDRADAALRRALVRLSVAEKVKTRRSGRG